MSSIITTVTAAVISVAVIAAVVLLAWHGSITGEAATGILGAIIGGGGVAVAQNVGVKTGAAAATTANNAVASTPVAPTTPTVSLKT